MRLIRYSLQVLFGTVALLTAIVGIEAWAQSEADVSLWWPLYGVGFPLAGAFAAWGVMHPAIGGTSRLLVPSVFVSALALLDDSSLAAFYAVFMAVALLGLVHVFEGLVLALLEDDE